MKMITAVIRPIKLDEVVLALEAVPGFPGMTVSEARTFGREHVEHLREPHDRIEDLTDFRSCIRVEILSEDELANEIVETLRCAAHTGRPTDGRVVVTPVEKAVDISCLDATG